MSSKVSDKAHLKFICNDGVMIRDHSMDFVWLKSVDQDEVW
jgi:hypothetical protein